jgi:hypothetical protein
MAITVPQRFMPKSLGRCLQKTKKLVTKIDVSFVLSDQFKCLQTAFMKGPANNLSVYINPMAMYIIDSAQPLIGFL